MVSKTEHAGHQNKPTMVSAESSNAPKTTSSVVIRHPPTLVRRSPAGGGHALLVAFDAGRAPLPIRRALLALVVPVALLFVLLRGGEFRPARRRERDGRQTGRGRGLAVVERGLVAVARELERLCVRGGQSARLGGRERKGERTRW